MKSAQGLDMFSEAKTVAMTDETTTVDVSLKNVRSVTGMKTAGKGEVMTVGMRMTGKEKRAWSP